MARRLDAVLRENAATVVRHEVFGSLDACAELARPGNGAPAWDWPVTWVEGSSCEGKSVAGMHVFAIAGPRVKTVSLGGRPVGRVYEDAHARHCLLGDVKSDAGGTRDEQCRQVFERIEAALAGAGFAMTQVPRTWLFLDDILAWYGVLNRVRREFFQERGLFDQLVPASTGVGVRNAAGAAMVAGAWAAKAVGPGFACGEVLSPMQCPAPAYGSCFSRASEIVAPDFRRVMVSGTASIEPKGASVCGGDMDGQIDLTLQVVRAILVSRGMDYGDVTRATAYIRHPSDAPLFREWCAKLGLGDWPLVTTQAVVCRDELLFEIEVDAIAPTDRHPHDWEI
jgi:enamine deaminase RidA (YjgF/YER057c/UK114 family)